MAKLVLTLALKFASLGLPLFLFPITKLWARTGQWVRLGVLQACASLAGWPKVHFPQSQDSMNMEREREGSPGNKELDVKKSH